MRSPPRPTSYPRKAALIVKELVHALLTIASVDMLGRCRMRRRGWHPASPDEGYLCDPGTYHDIRNTRAVRHDICDNGTDQHDHDGSSLAVLIHSLIERS